MDFCNISSEGGLWSWEGESSTNGCHENEDTLFISIPVRCQVMGRQILARLDPSVSWLKPIRVLKFNTSSLNWDKSQRSCCKIEQRSWQPHSSDSVPVFSWCCSLKVWIALQMHFCLIEVWQIRFGSHHCTFLTSAPLSIQFMPGGGLGQSDGHIALQWGRKVAYSPPHHSWCLICYAACISACGGSSESRA